MAASMHAAVSQAMSVVVSNHISSCAKSARNQVDRYQCIPPSHIATRQARHHYRAPYASGRRIVVTVQASTSRGSSNHNEQDFPASETSNEQFLTPQPATITSNQRGEDDVSNGRNPAVRLATLFIVSTAGFLALTSLFTTSLLRPLSASRAVAATSATVSTTAASSSNDQKLKGSRFSQDEGIKESEASDVARSKRAIRREWAASMLSLQAKEGRLNDDVAAARMELSEKKAVYEAAKDRAKDAKEAREKDDVAAGRVKGAGKKKRTKADKEKSESRAEREKEREREREESGVVTVKSARRAMDAAHKRADELTAELQAVREELARKLTQAYDGMVEESSDRSKEKEEVEREARVMGGVAAAVGKEVQTCIDKPGVIPSVAIKGLRWATGQAGAAGEVERGGLKERGEKAEGSEGVGGEVGSEKGGEGASGGDKSLGWLKWAQQQRAAARKKHLGKGKGAKTAAVVWADKTKDEILRARDSVMASVYLNPAVRSPLLGASPSEGGRWEMPVSTLQLAIRHGLVSSARLRHDRHAAFVALKGDEEADREYFVDLLAFDVCKEETGGTDAIYLQLMSHGVPTSVQIMWVPFDQWDPLALYSLPARVLQHSVDSLKQVSLVKQVLPWYLNISTEAAEETFFRFLWPLMPRPLKSLLKLDYSEGAKSGDDVALARMGFLADAERRFVQRSQSLSASWPWWMSLPAKLAVATYPMRFLLGPALGLVSMVLAPAPLEENEVQYKRRLGEKLQRMIGGRPIDGAEEASVAKDSIKEAFDRMKRVRRPAIALEDFSGMDAVKEEVREVILFLRDPRKFLELGARPPRGVLITGPSGSGKTSLALAIAAAARVPVVDITASDIDQGGYVGQGAANVRQLFQMAREISPMIIMMENFEQIGAVRGSVVDTRLQDKETVINQLLVELDGFESHQGVVLLAITDDPNLVDPALRRPGRMDRVIEVPVPNFEEREAILKQAAHETIEQAFADALDWKQVARRTAGMKPTELRGVPKRILLAAGTAKPRDEHELAGMLHWFELYNILLPPFIRNLSPLKATERRVVNWLGLSITPEDASRILPSIDFMSLTDLGMDLHPPYMAKWDRSEKLPHAIWAAGRGLLAALLPSFDRVDNIWLEPDSWQGIGFTRFTRVGSDVDADIFDGTGALSNSGAAAAAAGAGAAGDVKEVGLRGRAYAEKTLVLQFGSHVAAALLLPQGESNSLATPQLRYAIELSESMVMDMAWGPSNSPMLMSVTGQGGYRSTLPVGDRQRKELQDQIQEVHDTAYARAIAILERNRPVLEALVDVLCTRDAVDYETLETIMQSAGAQPEEEPFELFPYTDPSARMMQSQAALKEQREKVLSLPATSTA